MDTDNAHQQESSSASGGTLSTGKTWSPVASLVSIVLAVAAAMAFWLLMRAYHPVFRLPPEFLNVSPYANAETVAAAARVEAETSQRNAILTLATLGILMGIALGAAGGLLQRSLKLIVIAAILGAILGGLGGALGGFASHLTYVSIKPPFEPISLKGTSIVQVIALGLAGMGIGLGTGIALRSTQPTIESTLFGLLAGAAAGLVFPITLAAALPTIITEGVITNNANAQLLWVMLTALFLGLILPMAGSKRQKRAAPAAASPSESA